MRQIKPPQLAFSAHYSMVILNNLCQIDMEMVKMIIDSVNSATCILAPIHL